MRLWAEKPASAASSHASNWTGSKLILRGSKPALSRTYSVATRSILAQVAIDRAGKAHNCQANDRHRIQKGDVRLKVRNGLGWDHYCKTCADQIIARAYERLKEIEPMTPSGGVDV